MELDSLKLANLLHAEFDVHLIVRSGTKLKELATSRPTPYQVIDIAFRGSFDPRCIWALRKMWAGECKGPVLFLGASELKSIYFALQKNQMCIIRHGTTKLHSKKDFFHRWLYQKVTHHVSLGEHLRKNVIAIFPGPKNCLIIRPSTLLPKEVKNIESKGVPRILIFGRIMKEKGVEDGILALSRILKQGQDFILTIQGPCEDANYISFLKNMTMENMMEGKVQFLSGTRDVLCVYENHDILLFPSYGEGFPNTLVEALWSGLYPVVYKNTCFPEFLSLGFKMEVAIDRNEVDLSHKLIAALQKWDEKKEDIASHNKKLAQLLFSPEREKSEWAALINETKQ